MMKLLTPWDWSADKVEDAARSMHMHMAELLEVWLEWRTAAGCGALRIVCSDPGKRQYTSDLAPHFKLHPPRADHLGAVMSVAPEYPLPLDVAHGSAPADTAAAAPGGMRTPLRKAVGICEGLASNMGYFTRCLRSMTTGESADAAGAAASDAMVADLTGRLRETMHSVVRGKYVFNPERTAMCDASLTVRVWQSFVAPRVLVGDPARQAALDVLLGMRCALQGQGGT